MAELLLKDCFYIHRSSEEEPLTGWDILLRDNRIEKISKGITEEVDRVIDCSHLVVVPGFVNTHHHFYQTLTRNLPGAQNAELFDWLVYLYEIWKHLDENAIYHSSLLAMGELLKTGCTTSTDHHYVYPQGISADIMGIQFKAAETLGMRFSPTRGSMSLSRKDGGLPPDSVVQPEDEILRDSERVIREYHDNSGFSMRKIVLAPCSPFSVTEKLMKESAGLARQYGVRLHTHLAETKDENAFCVEKYGRRPLQLMEDWDFLGDDVFYAHGIHFNDHELTVLSEAGAHIAHCPSSNMRLGSGICRVKEMLPVNINVGLGVDGSASNDTSDLLGEIRNALLLQRVHYGAAAITTLEVFDIATINGAKLLNFNRIGRIREGWAADIALFNVHKMEYCGSLSDPLAALIFSGYNHGTEYTIVNGKVVVERGVLTGIDEDELVVKANAISERMIKENC